MAFNQRDNYDFIVATPSAAGKDLFKIRLKGSKGLDKNFVPVLFAFGMPIWSKSGGVHV